MSTAAPRLLFFAEAVTLAHVARPLQLAGALDPQRHVVRIACAERFAPARRDLGGGLDIVQITSIASEQFMDALRRGTPVYSSAELERYVEDDLAVIDEFRPDMVIGDFRLSLSVSARLRQVPYVNLVNASWSPYALRERLPMPEHATVGLFGPRLAGTLFNAIAPWVFRLHARPLNAVRRRYGLAPLPDLRAAYCDGDQVLYADTPELVRCTHLPTHHRFLGPLVWSPAWPWPEAWRDMPADRPRIYITLGSSGSIDALPTVLDALSELPVAAMLATAGRALPGGRQPANVWTTDFVAGSEAARRSAVVVCSGGSATVYQSLAEGTPVVGIAANLDQYLTMQDIERVGAGICLRSDALDPAAVRAAVQRVLDDPGYRHAAGRVAGSFRACDARSNFRAFIDEMFPDRPATSG